MVDEAEVLFANDRFYAAFAGSDADAMDALWDSDGPISCIHPGRPALHGRDAVLETWRAILTAPDAPVITCHEAVADVHGDVGVVTCIEEVGGSYLAATNVFIRRGRNWAMVHHQAGPARIDPRRFEEETDEPVN